jgi:hypothetical protein
LQERPLGAMLFATLGKKLAPKGRSYKGKQLAAW